MLLKLYSHHHYPSGNIFSMWDVFFQTFLWPWQMIPAWGIFQVKTMLYKNLGDLSTTCSGGKQYGSSSRNEQLLCDPVIPFWDMHPKHLEAETGRCLDSHVCCSTRSSRKMETVPMSTNRRMGQNNIQWDIISTLKRN